MFEVAHSEQQNVSSYKNYPIEKPFINTNWTRPSRTLSKAYPESNRDIIMSSLKKLQEKINHLELQSERGFMKNEETNRMNHHVDDLDNQSIETENKVNQLEKQLERMRKMVDEHERVNYDDWANSTKRLRNLEKESMLLDADFNSFDDRFQSFDVQPPKIVNCKRSPSRKSRRDDEQLKNKKQSRSKSACKRSQSSLDGQSHCLTGSHYRLNIGDIPFVVGKSTTQSHHLGSNVQNVISLLKLHHPKLCNSVAHVTTPKAKSTKKVEKAHSHRRSSSVPPAPKETHISETTEHEQEVKNSIDCLTENEMREFLRQLQEEYTKLVLAHYDITKRIMNCEDDKMRHELELKAHHLDKKMKSKAKQISKLKTYYKKNNARSKSSNGSKSKSQSALKKKQQAQTIEGSHLKCLKFFKDIKKLQNQIQNDQIIFN